MQRLARWHIWLGWLVGLPVLMWSVTGLFMVARPIEEVRGDSLQAAPRPIDPASIVLPQFSGPIQAAHLAQHPDGPVWLVTEADGGRYRYSAHDGTLIPPVVKEEAQRIADDAYAGPARLESVAYVPADEAPVELRRKLNSWQARFADGTHVYIDDATGEVLALRSSQWRLYDLMWGLHIMAPREREDTSHAALIIFAALSVIGAGLGCVLLFRRRKARVRAP